MELLKKKRKPLRASFTRMFNNLMSISREINVKSEDVESKLCSLERIASDLAIIDEELCNILLKDETKADEFDKEFASIEEYRENLDIARVRVKSFLQNLKKEENEPLELNLEKTKLKLPKIELVKFGGEVKDWLTFWSQFSRIHENKLMEDEDKFQYLIQCMTVGSRAREIIDSYPPTGENYSKAIESLKTRFGREELLIEFYVRELLALVVKNATNLKSTLSMTQLYDKLESHLRSLESIGMTSDKYAAMLFPLVESCIPEETLRVWLRNSSINKENNYSNKLTQLLFFLRTEVEGEERISLAKSGFKQTKIPVKPQKYKEIEYLSQPTANDLLSEVKEIRKMMCIFCGKQHESKDCFKGPKLPFDEKQDILKKNKCCFTCLKVGHRSKNCKANVRCMICSKRHWAILCPDLTNSVRVAVQDNRGTDQNVTLSNHCQSEVFLQTLTIALEAPGRRRIVRALIDTGSQRSYILKSTADQMRFKPVGSETLTHVVFGGDTSRKKHNCYRLVVSSLENDYKCEIQVLEQLIICGSIPRPKKGSWMNELREKGIQLSDIGSSQPQIELLIGADIASKLYTGRVVELRCGLAAVETHFGWTVLGKFEEESCAGYVTSLLTHSQNISDLWNLEAIGITDPCEHQSQEELEKAAIHHFQNTVQINEEGRYEVSLPWTQSREELPSNREIAGKRLLSTTSRLVKEGKLDSYATVFKEWHNEGIIEESNEGVGHYLPHRGVFKTNSSTNVRPVFDASCKARGLLSLNDCLMKGPNLLEVIPRVLLKFRKEKIGVISDIRKAFLQISVREEDRQFLKFLWWKDREQNTVKVYQHCRVVFGLNCSPFLLGAVIYHHLNKYSSSPLYETAEKLKTSFYVDNCVTSVSSKSELQNFIASSTEIMAEAKLELRSWEHTDVTVSNVMNESSPVLGLLWDKSEDMLYCDVKTVNKPEGIVTRRSILAIAQRVFDPIGFSCPVTLYPKLLLQESWRTKLSWDAEVSEDIRGKFLKWVQDIKMLNLLRIPRHAFLSDSLETSLHTFCDACGTSYAAVVYIRCQLEHKVSVQLLMAKSRVAPLKKISIPRLELLACSIGARLADFVKNSLNLNDVRVLFWTDSTTALQWIKRNEPWGVFVQNRVKEIRKLSHNEDWRHIPGQCNPADLPSRGCSVEKLIKSRWWEGPTWMKQNEAYWPSNESLINEEEILNEKKKNTIILVNGCSEDLLSRLSSYSKTVRMIGWIYRFVHNCKSNNHNRTKGELSADELDKAELIVLKIVQEDVFTESYINGLKSLNVFKDQKGIFRVKTKLTERKDTECFRNPILLPSKHKLVELLIREHHLTMMHAGLQILLSNLRERFWIVNGRKTVRAVISRCVRCKRHCSKFIKSPPAALPEDRVKEASVFEVTGIDLAGPLILKGGEKSWIVLYTCAVYRAIHLELVTSLSTKAFLLSFRRFIARRGRPKVIYSDNGTNFVGADNLFQNLDWHVIEVEASIKRIKWKFIPPSAAWWGGFWERIVKMIKNLLRRVLGKASLYYEEMMSILCDCESIVNSRPLTYLSEDSEDLIALTPSMFLQSIQTVGTPDLDQLDNVDLKKRWRYQQTLREHLRKRFRLEYLGQLLQHKNSIKRSEIKIGDVVLVENDIKRKTFWPLAKIVEIYPGKDGNIRVVKLKTATGEIIRPVQRIYPLEIRSPIDDAEGEADNRNMQDCPDNVPERTVTTRCGRTVKLPLRFRDT